MKINQVIKLSCVGFASTLMFLACNNANSKSGSEGSTGADSSQTEEGFVAMFDPNSLSGWEGDTTYWHMKDGVLKGEIKPGKELKANTFLIWNGGETGDFELKGKFKISADGNSGINYRSERFAEVPFALKGYQADIDGKNNYTGQNYEERSRTTLAYRGQRTEILNLAAGEKGESRNNAWSHMKVIDTIATAEELKNSIKENDWNDIRIVASGNTLTHYVNGQLISEVIDNDTQLGKSKGLIGVQVHVGPPMTVEYKDMMIKVLK